MTTKELAIRVLDRFDSNIKEICHEVTTSQCSIEDGLNMLSNLIPVRNELTKAVEEFYNSSKVNGD